MTLEELYEGLSSLGYKIAYDHFNEGEAPEPPYITYNVPGTDNFEADGIAYIVVNEIDINLYTDKKDLIAEKKIEDFLTEKEIYFERNEQYIESEKMYKNTFEISI